MGQAAWLPWRFIHVFTSHLISTHHTWTLRLSSSTDCLRSTHCVWSLEILPFIHSPSICGACTEIHVFIKSLWSTCHVLNARATCIHLPSVRGAPTLCQVFRMLQRTRQTWSQASCSPLRMLNRNLMGIYCTPTTCSVVRLLEDTIGDHGGQCG